MRAALFLSEFAITRQRVRMKRKEGRKEASKERKKERKEETEKEKEKIESDCARAPIILEILRRDSAIYLRRTSERVQQNTIGETGQREELKSGGVGGGRGGRRE